MPRAALCALGLCLGLAHPGLAPAAAPGGAPATTPPPRLAPTVDATMGYRFAQDGRPAMELEVAARAGGRQLRVSGPDLPVTLLIDRDAALARLLLPIAQAYAELPVAGRDPERGFLKSATFTKGARETRLGQSCTRWRAVSRQDRAEACITADGIILEGSLTTGHGVSTRVTALRVRRAPLDPALFRVPAGFTNTGSLPIPPIAPAQ